MAFVVGQSVNTVYGPGVVTEVRANDFVCTLKNWALAQGQSPTLYLAAESLTAIPSAFPGSLVKTVWGDSTVLKIRADNVFICAPVGWKLAQGQPPTLYLNPFGSTNPKAIVPPGFSM